MSDSKRLHSYAAKSLPGVRPPSSTLPTPTKPLQSTSKALVPSTSSSKPSHTANTGASISQIRQQLPTSLTVPVNKSFIPLPSSTRPTKPDGQPEVIHVPADMCLNHKAASKKKEKPSKSKVTSVHPKNVSVKRLPQTAKPMMSKASVKLAKASNKPAKAPSRKKKAKEAKIANLLNEDPNVFTVEKVVNKKVEDGQVHYLIRWLGYGPEDDTWEPKDDCNCDEAIRKFESVNLPTQLSSTSKKPLRFSTKKSTYVPKKKKYVSKKGSDNAKDPGSGLSAKHAVNGKPDKQGSIIPWHILDQRTLRVVPQLFRDRLEEGQPPARILDHVNPPLDSDDGCQRYLCEWSDEVTCWLPGKLCCKIIPKLVCSFMLHALLTEPDTVTFLTS